MASEVHPRRRGTYGLDAPGVLLALSAGGALLLAAAPWAWAQGAGLLAVLLAVAALVLLATSASYLYTSRRGKFRAWSLVLADLGLRGDERVLDLGCGRGAVLLLAARLLPRGRATGLDLWSRSDQSGNGQAAARRNAICEGVEDRIELRTGDMRSLPFADRSYDLVLSSLAIHNISRPSERAAAIDEAVRVLRPGGRLAIADILCAGEYARQLRGRGLSDVRERSLGPGCWFGPWMATRLVTARKAS